MSILREFPILEFDPDTRAFIEPGKVIRPIDIAERCVICFFKEVDEDDTCTRTVYS